MKRLPGRVKAVMLFFFLCFTVFALKILHSIVMQKSYHSIRNSNEGLKKNWEHSAARTLQKKGPGEQGNAVKLEVLQKQISLDNGFNAILSDYISVNRSLPDIRLKSCRNKQYLSKLPTVSVVIPFYNEYFSVLIRSVHSVINRSPPELIKEIILADDFSDRENLFQPLNDYVAQHLEKTQIVRLPKRVGLIGARLAGMRKATGDVLLVLDSHVEVNQNWLPPLLEPIALNSRVCVCPQIDIIEHENFKYENGGGDMRGAFDWNLDYKGLPRFPTSDKTKPFRTPIMEGGLFAIKREFFWELGGYDEGLDIWGGEQYELSFKIWMCGGELLIAPCSRVGHVYRGPRHEKPSPREAHDFVHRNYKRVAEVWMDQYKQYLYEHEEGVYEKIDAGDLTAQKALRERLKCHSFKWYMENIAFDIPKKYPLRHPPAYAYGVIRSVAHPAYCLDTLNRDIDAKVGLYVCDNNFTHPRQTQNWEWSWYQDIRVRRRDECLDVIKDKSNADVWRYDCHEQGGNQLWYYDHKKKFLMHGPQRTRCLDVKKDKKKALQLVVNTCNSKKKSMQWLFGAVNNTALIKLKSKSKH